MQSGGSQEHKEKTQRTKENLKNEFQNDHVETFFNKTSHHDFKIKIFNCIRPPVWM